MKNFKEFITEKSVPNNPKLWSRAKALAKQKFDVYPQLQTDEPQDGISPKVELGYQRKRFKEFSEDLRKWFDKKTLKVGGNV